MKKSWVPLLLAAFFSACENESPQKELTECEVNATVVDLSELDACGFVFELENGERLEPFIFFCGTPPLSAEQQVLSEFEFVDGKKVKLGYKLVPEGVSACQAGKLAMITCITEVESQDD
jgi:hypothetical protein